MKKKDIEKGKCPFCKGTGKLNSRKYACEEGEPHKCFFCLGTGKIKDNKKVKTK